MDETRAHVAVVEDEEPLRRLWHRVLERAGHRCTVAATAKEAREQLAREQPDVLLCDIHLPDESGITLLRDIRADHPETAVIIVSGMGDGETAEETIRLGAFAYLIKPIGPKQVLMTVSNALSRRDLERQHNGDRVRLERSIEERDAIIAAERDSLREREEAIAQSAKRIEERTALAAALKRRADTLELLVELQRSIPPRAPLPKIARALADAALRMTGADVADAWLFVPSGGAPEPVVVGSAGLGLEQIPDGQKPHADGIVTRALTTDAPVSAGPDAQPEALGSRLAAAGLTSGAAVSLRDGDAIVGVIAVGAKSHEPLTSENLKALCELASHAAIVAASAGLRERLPAVLRDAVSGLPTRKGFVALAAHELEQAGDDTAPPAVAVVAIDAFSGSPGSALRSEAAGAELVRAAAAALRSAAGGPAAYLGRGTFAVLIDDETGRADPDRASEQLRAIVAEAVEPERVRHGSGSASAGLAYGEADAELLIRNACAALLRARRRGGGRLERFRPELRHTLRADDTLEADLVCALERGEMTARFQPIVALAHRSIAVLDATPLWLGGRNGAVSPLTFMPLAEEIGVADVIGRRVLEFACTNAARWSERFRGDRPLAVSVRLTASELARQELVDDVAEAVDRAELNPSKLIAIVDEATLAGCDSTLAGRVHDLAGLGVRICADDFGGGTTPVDYLESLPIELVRVDRALVDALGDDPEHQGPLLTITELATARGIEVVAHGVVGAAQAAKLRGMGCAFAQGSYVSAPLTAGTVTAMFQRANRGAPVLTPGAAT